jgi:hypothetical protein
VKRAAALALLRAGFVCCVVGWGVCCAPCDIASGANLAVERIALHQFEDGPLLASSYEFLPGETAYFSCRVTGYQTKTVDDDREDAKLSWRMDVRDPAGALLEEPAQGSIAAELFPEDTKWLPKFLKSFVVPPFAISGEYRISVRVRDEIGGGEIAGELKFRVKGQALNPSDALAARNVVFLSGEDDTLGTRSGLYHPGGTVRVRMDVSGYKFGDKNRFSISFGMALENAEGKPLFTQADAGSETDESFYPQRYSTGTLTFNLDKDVPAGAYTLVVTIRDQIGGQSYAARAPFQVQ